MARRGGGACHIVGNKAGGSVVAIGMEIAALTLVLYAVAARLARLAEPEDTWLLPRPRLAGPLFTALMVLGLAACAAGLPYVPEAMRWPLAGVLGVALLASALDSVPTGAAVVCWILPVLWFIGGIDDAICFCGNRPRAVHFTELAIALFSGCLVLRLARRPPPGGLPPARIHDKDHAA